MLWDQHINRMDTLYILGNGFDLFHNLPTGYGNFQNFVTKNSEELENTLENYVHFKLNLDGLWTSFEEDLASFDWKSFFDDNCHIDIMDEGFRPSFAYSLEDDLLNQTDELVSNIRNAFHDWLINIDLESSERKLQLSRNSLFLSFNYTLTLEEVYQIEKENILHIHGDIEGDPEELIFGHNTTLNEEPELDENGDSNRTSFTDSENTAKYPFHNFYKPVEDIISKHSKTFEQIKNIRKIYVLGHSLNSIDLPYFKKIANHANSATWNVSYFANNEEERHLFTLNKIGIPSTQINLFKLDTES